jgi:8-amino-7-oxononanoate synthase
MSWCCDFRFVELDYLINFARSIYTTGFSPHSVATILVAYNLEKQKTILKYCKTSFISIRKEFVGIKTAFCPQPNQHTISHSGNEK